MEWCWLRTLSLLLPSMVAHCFDLPADHIVIQSGGSNNVESCWGYEAVCQESKRYSHPKCNYSGERYSSFATARVVRSNRDLEEVFYLEADFGYIKRKRESFKFLCRNETQDDSFLACQEQWQSCHGKDIVLDLTRLPNYPGSIRYKNDVLRSGEIYGKCKKEASVVIDADQIIGRSLSDWSIELRNLADTDMKLETMDVVEVPVYFVKIEIPFSLYHHLSDFFNFYLTLHLYNDRPDAFSKDIQIVLWENVPYESNLEVLWSAFSQHPVKTLADYQGRKVLFKKVIMALPSRMIDGLYYNAYIAPGCNSSGLFKGFRSLMVHRLGVQPQLPRDNSKVRVLLILRLTSWRRIINHKQIVERLQQIQDITVTAVHFTGSTDILEQLQAITATDVLMALHGSGLSHMLFLPEWATVFEMYNCGDPRCYADLARLVGLNYITWEDPSKIRHINHDPAHESAGVEKFTNYELDVDELARLVRKSVNLVRQHPKWIMKQNENKDEL